MSAIDVGAIRAALIDRDADPVKWDLAGEVLALRDRVKALTQAFDLIEDMAREHAEAGGRHGPEMRTFNDARELAGKS